jgi:RNA polymerase sigma-70 factor (ECF subfamily)
MCITRGGKTSTELALLDPDMCVMLGVRADEPGAFADLVDRFQHRLVGMLLQLVGNKSDAEDLAQEVFIRVYRARKRYQARSKVSTWLFSIAHNLARNLRRAQQRKHLVSLSHDCGRSGPSPAARVPDESGNQPVRRIEQEELEAVIRRAVDGLKERQRMAVLLNKFEGLGYAEIGHVMSLTPQAVKSLLFRARFQLREALRGYV